MKDIGVLAVDISTAPQKVQDEIEALKGRINSPKDLDEVSNETRKWIIDHADHNAMGMKMVDMIENSADELGLYIRGISMLQTIVPKHKADATNLKLYNACAAYIREYNIRKLES